MQSRPRQILTLNIIKAKTDLIACAIPLVLELLYRDPGLSMAVEVTSEQDVTGMCFSGTRSELVRCLQPHQLRLRARSANECNPAA